jgi:hypothetical protein
MVRRDTPMMQTSPACSNIIHMAFVPGGSAMRYPAGSNSLYVMNTLTTIAMTRHMRFKPVGSKYA